MTSPAFRVERTPARRFNSKLRTVRLHLAREPKHPNGSELHGYGLIAPLDAHGMLDPSLWRKERAQCRVVRFWAGEQTLFGMLVRRHGGAGGATWGFDFDPDRADDDEIGVRLDIHRFRTGDYVTIKHLGEAHVFRVASVDDFAPENRLPPLAPGRSKTERDDSPAA
ncbi:hypothetical protein IHQ68_11550 [Chelatococcus sambhunathii]|uniref:Uncharacterized protein n=1 Tax=Chelatococcus sambhunathii TaxID=363953 RepID=A0ABU1DGK2_9HYPH|nr:hypothetical protein [Chelatococcus sambhunathii]MDR4307253.1 hypothetical protein [Chelatococcus sambhunathii]